MWGREGKKRVPEFLRRTPERMMWVPEGKKSAPEYVRRIVGVILKV
jgi:hypothetical protein